MLATRLAVAAAGQSPATIIDLGPRLEELRATNKVPALGAVVVTADGIVARGVAGVRKQDDPTPVQPTDLWHIGSITKSFTSTLFARQVEAGKIRFEQTLASVLPEAAGTPYAEVTFEQLLSHRSGMPANPAMATMAKSRTSKDPLIDQRRAIVAEMLATPPVSERGTAFLYSNAGYVVTGAALERLTGTPWEDLVRAQVLAPLDLRSAGFGPPGTAATVDQPYGHINPVGSTRPPQAILPGPFADNPAFLGPAGTLHLSLDDLATYVRDHMNGESGTGSLLSQDSYRRLHRALGDSAAAKSIEDGYALGWIDTPADWAQGERIVWHNGSNTVWFAMIGFLPARGFGVVVVTNGGAGGEAAVGRTFRELVRERLGEGAAAQQ